MANSVIFWVRSRRFPHFGNRRKRLRGSLNVKNKWRRHYSKRKQILYLLVGIIRARRPERWRKIALSPYRGRKREIL